jgi:hypothetical protein
MTLSDTTRLAVRAVRAAAALCTREGGTWADLAPLLAAAQPVPPDHAALHLLARRFQQLCALQTHCARQPADSVVAACVGAVAAETCRAVPQGSAHVLAGLTLAARCNAFTVAVYSSQRTSVERLRAGLALYPAAAMMNHS